MKFILTLIFILALTIVGIFTLTPAKYQLPGLVQIFMNLRDPNADHDGNLDEIEAMQKDPLLCYQNTDCIIQKCGRAPNCNSNIVNSQYSKLNRGECTEIACPEQLDAYVACQDNECTLKTLFPSPTPITN